MVIFNEFYTLWDWSTTVVHAISPFTLSKIWIKFICLWGMSISRLVLIDQLYKCFVWSNFLAQLFDRLCLRQRTFASLWWFFDRKMRSWWPPNILSEWIDHLVKFLSSRSEGFARKWLKRGVNVRQIPMHLFAKLSKFIIKWDLICSYFPYPKSLIIRIFLFWSYTFQPVI